MPADRTSCSIFAIFNTVLLGIPSYLPFLGWNNKLTPEEQQLQLNNNLLASIKDKNLDNVNKYLSLGANINFNNYQPLDIAIKYTNIFILDALLNNGNLLEIPMAILDQLLFISLNSNKSKYEIISFIEYLLNKGAMPTQREIILADKLDSLYLNNLLLPYNNYPKISTYRY